MEKKLWFRAKRYGWGWTPSTWQGWLVLGVYLVAVIGIFRVVDRLQHSVSDSLMNFMPLLAILTFVLLWICYAKGETPRWRWGDDKNDKK